MSPAAEELEYPAGSELNNGDSETSFKMGSVAESLTSQSDNFEMGEIESTSLKPADRSASFKLCSESFGSEYSAMNDRPSAGME